ncbi:hypothetical protein ID866_5139 [Astraeus odoratus]|nr:hypothetical protein ID866_5139 [Astraeus odoratus]
MSVVARFHDWPRYCTGQARKIVLDLIRSNPPLTTRQIYDLVKNIPPAQSSSQASTVVEHKGTVSGLRGIPPPEPNSPIRSLRYLKRVVLADLAKSREVEKFHTIIQTKQSPNTDAWLWRVKQPKQPADLPNAAADSTPGALAAGIADLTPAAVGIGEDWSHLNKRRQRSRQKKLERDLKRMTTIQNAKREAAQQILVETTSSKSSPIAP